MTTGTNQGMDAAQRNNVAKLLFESGNVELQAGRTTQALNYYKQSLGLSPKNPNVFNNMGIAQDRLNNLQGALESFGNAYLINPDDPGIVNNLTTTLIKVERFKTAAELATKPGSRVLYPIAVTALRSYLGSKSALQEPDIQNLLAPYDKLIQELGLPPDDAEKHLCLFANFKHPENNWREIAISRLSNEDFPKWVAISGLEPIKELQAVGKGAILLSSHTTSGHAILVALLRQELKVNSIEFNNRFSALPIPGIERVNFLEVGNKEQFALREVYLAQQALQRGEILHLTGDGFQGKSQFRHPFLGKLRAFRTGFADLSLITNTPIFPVFCTTTLEGKINIEILPALAQPNEQLPRETRIATLLDQYVALLEKYWKTKPGNISWRHVKKHLGSEATIPDSHTRSVQ